MDNPNPVSANLGLITLEGTYQGKNLYVQNPFSGSGIGFCVYEVRVNGRTTTDEIGASAFEIDFRNLNLKPGDAVKVELFHKDTCSPKVLNPEVLKPRSTFVVTAIQADPAKGTLAWTSTDERGKLTYIIEQFRWNRWVSEGETEGTGTAGPNTYSYSPHFVSGENQFRVKQVDYTGQPRTSSVVKCTSGKPKVSFVNDQAQKRISFSAETVWQVMDMYGNKIKQGKSNGIDTTDLKKGGYFLNYDNDTGQFIIK